MPQGKERQNAEHRICYDCPAVIDEVSVKAVMRCFACFHQPVCLLTAALAHAKEAVRLVRRLTRRQTSARASHTSEAAPLPAAADDLAGLAFNAGMVLAAAHAAAGNGSEALAAYQRLIDDNQYPDVRAQS